MQSAHAARSNPYYWSVLRRVVPIANRGSRDFQNQDLSVQAPSARAAFKLAGLVQFKKKICKFFQIPRHIKSLYACMEY